MGGGLRPNVAFIDRAVFLWEHIVLHNRAHTHTRTQSKAVTINCSCTDDQTAEGPNTLHGWRWAASYRAKRAPTVLLHGNVNFTLISTYAEQKREGCLQRVKVKKNKYKNVVFSMQPTCCCCYGVIGLSSDWTPLCLQHERLRCSRTGWGLQNELHLRI